MFVSVSGSLGVGSSHCGRFATRRCTGKCQTVLDSLVLALLVPIDPSVKAA